MLIVGAVSYTHLGEQRLNSLLMSLIAHPFGDYPLATTRHVKKLSNSSTPCAPPVSYTHLDVYKRQLYDLRYRYSADYDWCIKIINAIHSQYRIDDYLVNYLNEGVTTRNHRASLLERLRIMARRYGRCV